MKMTRSLSRRMTGAMSAAVVAVPLFVPAGAHAADKKIERLWKANCASCHGGGGKGDTEKGAKLKLPDMSTAEWQKKRTDDEIKKTIVKGVNETRDGVKKEMDAFPDDKLTPEQRDGLVTYIRTFKQ